jgi:hypothetical protein
VRLVRRDRNHAEIVAALRGAGCSVQDLAAVGGGVPDILVGRKGRNFLLEIKDGSLPPSDRRLNDSQVAWHRAWRGQTEVVLSVEDALRVVELLPA